METSTRSHEYTYTHSKPQHHHAYLLAPLLTLLTQPSSSLHQKLRVLDLGCGNGSLSQKIAQAGYDVTGVESSASGIRLANHNVPECHFIQASIYDLPSIQLEQAFDIVIAAEVIEHLLYPRELIQTAKKCLKPNGQLILTTPYHGYWKNLVLAATGKMDQHFTVLWDGGHIKFFSVKTLTQLLEEAGFSAIQFKFSGRVPYLWKSMLCSSVMMQD